MPQWKEKPEQTNGFWRNSNITSLGQVSLVTDHTPLQRMAKNKDNNRKVTCCFLSLQGLSYQEVHSAGPVLGNQTLSPTVTLLALG